MSIRPENKDRYPRNWKVIRQAVLERAGNRCEWCGLDNGETGYRDRDGKFYSTCRGTIQDYCNQALFAGQKSITIVLTVAHLDHQPENNDLSNLAALCQRCHNRHDVADRIAGKRSRRCAAINKSQTGLRLQK